MNVAVIGSGVSGISVVHALVERGTSVTIVDVGETLEPRRRQIVNKFKALPTEDWPEDELALLSENQTFGQDALPKKVFFGSDQIYASDRPFARTVAHDAGRAPYPTFSQGGFSNIWGAAVLAADSCDMADWPMSRAELDPYFRKAAELLPMCGGAGTLARSFPAYKEELGELDPGPQGRSLLEDLQRAEGRLLDARTLYGKARLAIYTTPGADGELPCNGCGHCFTGCVRGSIYATVPKLEAMIRTGRVVYRAALFAERVGEEDGRAVIDGIDLTTNRAVRMLFDAVFIAAGPLNTTRLLMRSAELYDRVVTLKESQKFAVPMLRRRGAATAIEQPSVTLASAFIETKVPKLSDHWVHVQVVPMNKMILDGIRFFRRGGRIVRGLAAPALRHMNIAWCGMHSDHSSHLEVSLGRDNGSGSRLDLKMCVSPEARAAARKAARALFDVGLSFGTVFCFWMIRFSNPGSGTHCGASFPMRRNPVDRLDTDVFGRPFGWSRIFAVDASVLPSIPGTTLAFTVMANAFRIGATAPL